MLGGQLGAEPVHVVVGALDGDDVAAVDGGGDDLGHLEVVGDEDDRDHAGARRMGGHGVGQVAGRGAGGHLEAELAGLGEGHGHDPVLEGSGGVGRVVLDPELPEAELGGQAVGPHERGAAGAEVDGGGVDNGQQRGVAPDRLGPGRDARARLTAARRAS